MMNINCDLDIVKHKNEMFKCLHNNTKLLDIITNFANNSNDLSKLYLRIKNSNKSTT